MMLDIDERVQHGLEMTAADLMIKPLCEAFEVHIRRIHVLVELHARFLTDVARRYRHRLDTQLMACLRHIDRIFQKNDQIVVGEGYTAVPEMARSLRDPFW